MYGVARGAAYLFAGGMTISVNNDWYSGIGNNRCLGVPMLVILTAIACLIMHYLLSQTRFGQHTYAMGASQAAARRAGINITSADDADLSPLRDHGRRRRRALYRPLHRRRAAGGRAAAARLRSPRS